MSTGSHLKCRNVYLCYCMSKMQCMSWVRKSVNSAIDMHIRLRMSKLVMEIGNEERSRFRYPCIFVEQQTIDLESERRGYTKE